MNIRARMGVVLAILAIAGGCSKKATNSTNVGPHGAAWIEASSADFHGKRVAAEGDTICADCHGVTASDPQNARIVALSCAKSAACHQSADGPTKLNCESCHARAALPGAHNKHYTMGVSCGVCHSTAIDNAGLPVDSLHMNARLDIAIGRNASGTWNASTNSCDNASCHRGDSPKWTDIVGLTCTGAPACHSKASLPNGHQAHFVAMEGNCGICHTTTALDSTGIVLDGTHIDGSTDVAIAAAFGGTYDATAGTCAGNACHGATVTTPGWTSGTNLICANCHTTATLSDTHDSHFDVIAGNCELCHNTVAKDSTVIISPARHANRMMNIALAPTIGGTFNTTGHTCASTYCHGASTTTSSWVSPTSLDCSDCHSTGALSATHARHTTKSCASCHANTASGSTTVISPRNHANGRKDVAFTAAIGGAFNDANGACAGTACHGVGSLNWRNPAPLDCGQCHPTATLLNAHQAHFAAMPRNCSVCHAETAVDSTSTVPSGRHFNGQTDVVMATVYGGTYNAVAGTCANNSCHGVSVTTPGWKSGTNLSCATCHTKATLSNTHDSHFAVMAGNCELCHNTVAKDSTAIVSSIRHANRLINVALSTDVGGTFSTTSHSCANTYCHVEGATTSSWTSPTSLSCASCHNAGSLSATHARHTTKSCASCHANTASGSTTVISPRNHANGQKDVAFTAAIGGAFNDANGACAGTACHGVGSLNWRNPAPLDCGQCHPTALLLNAHQAHFAEMPRSCSVCHAETAVDSTNIVPGGLHFNGQTDVVMATVYGGTYNAVAGTCANNSCHGVSVTTPGWRSGTKLVCATCHTKATLSDTHDSHFAVMAGNCELCHNTVAKDSTAIVSSIRHANRLINVALSTDVGGTFSTTSHSCANTYCHLEGATTSSWTSPTPLSCASCHNAGALSATHGKHFSTTPANCANCHANTASSATVVKSPRNHANGIADVALTGYGSSASYDDVQNTCAGTYCHGTATTSWTSPAPLDCQGCHAFTGPNGLSGAHPAHFAEQGQDCSTCHANTASSASVVSNAANHTNKQNDVALGTSWGGSYDPGTSTCGGTYCHKLNSPTPGWSSGQHLGCQSCHPNGSLSVPHAKHLVETNGDCATCHINTASDATTITSPAKHSDHTPDVAFKSGVGGSYNLPSHTCSGVSCHLGTTTEWSATVTLGCEGCHKFSELPGLHTAHFAASSVGNDCSKCHTGTASSNSALTSPTLHRNGSVDVVIAATYGGSFSFADSSCSGVVCHSGIKLPWVSAEGLDCETCHTFDALPAGHAAHFAEQANDCSVCHQTTAANSSALTSPTLHMNGTKDVSLKTPWGGSYAAGSCSATYCHEPGNLPTPLWTSGAVLTCQSCHPNGTLSGDHTKHLARYTNDCTICHSTTVSAPTTISSVANHANNVKDVAISSAWDGGTYSTSAKTCGSTYCHRTTTSPAWTITTQLTCNGGCHSYDSLPDRHAKHFEKLNGYRCDYCHNATTTGTSNTLRATAPHADKKKDVVFLLNPSAASYNPSTRGCSSVQCHVNMTW